MKTIGSRVGAILGSKDDVVEFLGFGIYEGDKVPDEAVGWMADALREQQVSNPCIVLDTGKVVYGCECWWGGEEKVRQVLEQAKAVITVDIDEIRKNYRANAK